MSRQFTRDTKRCAWERSQGRCEFERDGVRCSAVMTAGNRIYDHRIPHALSRDSSLANCQVICAACDREKTPCDIREIAGVEKVRDFHLGIIGPGLGRSPMPGGRRSNVSKTFSGVKPRQSQAERHRAMIVERFPEALR
jgi:hypothetical protein